MNYNILLKNIEKIKCSYLFIKNHIICCRTYLYVLVFSYYTLHWGNILQCSRFLICLNKEKIVTINTYCQDVDKEAR
jgi:hypothetical protein